MLFESQVHGFGYLAPQRGSSAVTHDYNQQRFVRQRKKKGILSIPTVFLSSLILGNGANLEIQKKIRCLVTKKIRKGMGEGGNSIEFSLNTILKNKPTYLNYELFSP